jgi:hypothetical protein
MTTPDELARLEHRLRDAYCAAAQAVGPATVRDLPAPAELARLAGAGPDAAPAGGTPSWAEQRTAYRQRAVTRRVAVPAAAFAAVAAAVLTVAVVVPRLVDGRTAAALAPGGAPAFYAAVKTDADSAVVGATELDIVSTATGRVVSRVPPPGPGLTFQVVTAISDDAFIAAAEPPQGATGASCRSWLYRFSLTGQGQPEQVTRLMPVAGLVPLRQLAASADGRTIAFGRTGCSEIAIGSGRGQIVVQRLAAVGSPAASPSGGISISPALASTPPSLASTPPALASTPPSLASTPPSLASTPPALASTPPALASTPPALASTPPASGTTSSSSAPAAAGTPPGATTVFTESPSAVATGLGLSARGDQLFVMTEAWKPTGLPSRILVVPASSPPGPLTQRAHVLLSDYGLLAMAASPAGPEVAGITQVPGSRPNLPMQFAVGEFSTDGGADGAKQVVPPAHLLAPPHGAAPPGSFTSRTNALMPLNIGRLRRAYLAVEIAGGLSVDGSGQHVLLFGWQQQSHYLNLETGQVTLVPHDVSSGRVRSAAW